MMFHKSKFKWFSYSSSKWVVKAAETTRNINTFGPGTAKEHTVQWWFNKFCKGDESLEDEEHSSWPLEVDNDQLRAITGADPLRTTEVAKELNTDHPMFIWHLKQIGKVKKLNKWVPHKVTANQKKKKRSFWTVVFSYSTQQQQTMSQSDCDVQWKMDCIKLVMTSSVAGPRRNPKALPKAKLAPKKVMVPVWWSAACLIHYSFLNPGQTITSEKYAPKIDEMYQKRQCLPPALVSRIGPVLLHDNPRPHVTQAVLQKLNKSVYEVLPHLP